MDSSTVNLPLESKNEIDFKFLIQIFSMVFQEDQNYDVNLYMRSSAILIVVNIPKTQYENYCFCDYGTCPKCGISHPLHLNCPKCKEVFYCSQACFKEHYKDHKKICNVKKLNACAQCNESNQELLKICDTCKSVVYCSKKCKKDHWKVHKKTCRYK